jgi:hypothetical protein
MYQMNCTLSAIAGVGLLGAAVYTSMVPKQDVNRLRDMVSGDAAKAYENISKERATLYVVGIAIGLVVAYLVVYTFGGRIANRFHRMTTFTAITLFTGVSFYTVYPKSDYMLNHIKNDKEAKAWMEVYKTMKMRYITGFVLGALAAVPLANAFC